MPMILVVDDSEVDRRLMGGLLEKDMDWLVTYAKNGVEAIEIIAQALPDAVLTDLSMPEMDGLELVVQCRKKFGNIPVILVTGQGSDELAMEALRKGASSYVPKTQLAQNLLETVEQVLAIREAERSNDRLIQCTINTRYKYQLDNDPGLIAPLVDRVQQVMIGMKICSPNERVHLAVALEEALLNALFHGNLELTPEHLPEVRKSLHSNSTSPLVEQRRAQAPYSDRRILVGIDLTHKRAEFVIRDEGRGFDASKLPAVVPSEELASETGRGLVLIRTFMDEVKFNETGNEIRMVRRRSSDTSDEKEVAETH